MMKRTLFLLALLLMVGSDILSLPAPASAQRTWPNDQGGRPAPPCTIYNSTTNTVSFCSDTSPLPVSPGSSTSGAGNPTGSTNDPLGWGRSIFESTQAFDSRTGAGGTSFRWEDASTITAIRRTAATTIQRWISTDRGQTYRLIQTNAIGGFANMGVMGGSIVLSQNGRYAGNLGAGGVGAASHAFSTSLITWSAATGSAVVPSGGNSFGGGAISLSPTTANRLISNRVNTTASTCIAVLSTDGGASYTATTTEQACAGSNPGIINYVGGTTWLWVIPGSGAAFRSTDDGGTWNAVTSPGANANASICVPPTAAPSGGLGYCLVARGAAGVQSISRTTDAGSSWTEVVPAVPAAVVNLWLSFSNYGNNILSLITDSNGGVITLWRSNDAGLTWSPAATVTYTGGSTPTGYFAGTPTTQRAAGSPTNGQGSAVWIPDGVAATQNPMYGSALAPGQESIVGTQGIPWTIDRAGRGVVATQQSITLSNTEVTSAVATANVFNFAATTGERWTIRRVDARCSAGTSGVTIESPVGTTIWTSLAAEVVAATRFSTFWNPGLTAATGVAMRVTVASCGGGNTSVVSVQADRAPAP